MNRSRTLYEIILDEFVTVSLDFKYVLLYL